MRGTGHAEATTLLFLFKDDMIGIHPIGIQETTITV